MRARGKPRGMSLALLVKQDFVLMTATMNKTSPAHPAD
jgi:hypothetical protein